MENSIDREKVVKEIEDALSGDLAKAGYIYGLSLNGLKDKALADALALLKEQEAVEPFLKREGRNKNYNDYCCPICDNEVVYEQNFCSECGRPFLWECR